MFAVNRGGLQGAYRANPSTTSKRTSSVASGTRCSTQSAAIQSWVRRELAWPANSAMATLVSSATLFPLTEIDVLELPFNDGSHLFGGIGRHTA